MSNQKKHVKPSRMKQFVVNAFAALGYSTILLQWAWAALFVGYPYFSTHPELFIPQVSEHSQPVRQIDFGAFSPAMTFIAIGIAVAVMLVTIIVIVKLPYVATKNVSRVTHQAAVAAVPIVTRHKKISDDRKREMSGKLVLVIKLSAIALAFTITLFAQPLADVSRDIILTISTLLAASSLLWVALEYTAAVTSGIRLDKAW